MESSTLSESLHAVMLAFQDAANTVSMKEFLSSSWDATGVAMALTAYALAAISTGCFMSFGHWVLKLLPGVVCAFVFVQSVIEFEAMEMVGLFAFAALVGAGCTHVQVTSWQMAFAHVASKRRARLHLKSI